MYVCSTYPNSQCCDQNQIHQKRFDHKKIYAKRTWMPTKNESQREKSFYCKMLWCIVYAVKVTLDNQHTLGEKNGRKKNLRTTIHCRIEMRK